MCFQLPKPTRKYGHTWATSQNKFSLYGITLTCIFAKFLVVDFQCLKSNQTTTFCGHVCNFRHKMLKYMNCVSSHYIK